MPDLIKYLFLLSTLHQLYGSGVPVTVVQRESFVLTKSWTEWYPWKECSKSCGVGYTSRSRIKSKTDEAGSDIDVEVQSRSCIININEDCTVESTSFWTKNDTSKLWTIVLMFLPVYMWLYTCLHWQKKRIGNLWDVEKVDNLLHKILPGSTGPLYTIESIPLELQTLSPSKRRLHMEMMRNLKILHMQMEEQHKVEKQLKDMENLKDNLLSLGLV